MRDPKENAAAQMVVEGALSRRSVVCGHFGELLQGRLGAEGPVVLVTLPCSALQTTAEYEPERALEIDVRPLKLRNLALAAFLAAFARCGDGKPRGRLSVHCAAVPGAGCGASTMTTLAVIRAVACAFGARLSPHEEAKLCLKTEGATDPLMFSEPGALLWASREARCVERLRRPPAFEALGVLDGEGRQTDPNHKTFANVSDLAAALAAAFDQSDRAMIGAIATECARRNRLDEALPHFDAIERIGRSAGSFGVAAAHTGSSVALLFPPGAPRIESAAQALIELGFPAPLRFKTT